MPRTLISAAGAKPLSPASAVRRTQWAACAAKRAVLRGTSSIRSSAQSTGAGGVFLEDGFDAVAGRDAEFVGDVPRCQSAGQVTHDADGRGGVNSVTNWRGVSVTPGSSGRDGRRDGVARDGPEVPAVDQADR
jgi:hypothetical protein